MSLGLIKCSVARVAISNDTNVARKTPELSRDDVVKMRSIAREHILTSNAEFIITLY
jgi:hypothetical protein